MTAKDLVAAAGSARPSVLGLDVGGTATRWALMTLDGELVAEGVAAGFSGAQMQRASEHERGSVSTRLHAIADQVRVASRRCELCAVCAGITGVAGPGDSAVQARRMLAHAFALPESRVTVMSDIELTCRAAVAAVEGYVVYAGTGSIAAFIDAEGELQRAGGRGVLLDDAGGGYWIAREALRRVWRREDEHPGAWRGSPMARALFTAVGGDASIFSVRYLMERERGVVGLLALVVAKHADDDALAAEILSDAGVELARLASAMALRYGQRKIVVTGRASTLHPLIESAMRRSMPSGAPIEFRQVEAHVAAARLAVAKCVNTVL